MAGRFVSGDLDVEILSARGGICTGVLYQCRGSALLVDCGDGIARDLHDRGVGADDLAALVLTHDHGDHTAGLPGLLWWLRLRKRSSPLPVLRPAEAPLAAALISAFAAGLGERARVTVAETRLAADVPLAVKAFTVTPFPVRHRASSASPRLLETYGLRIEAGGLRTVISADTGPCERLELEAVAADLAIVESSWPAGRDAVTPDAHLRADEAEAIGLKARAWLPYHVGGE